MAGPRLRAFRERALYRLLVIVAAVGRRIPLRAGQFLGRRLGSLAWMLARRERRKAERHIAMAFPEWDEATRRRTIRDMFRHLGMSLFELAWMWDMDLAARDRTTTFDGLDRVLEVIDGGNGIIIFTAHCGNWEWLSFATSLSGRPASVLQRERESPQMNRWITELRLRSGMRTIDRGSPASARQMIEAVRRGGILGFVMDQNIRTESVKVPFFGHPAPTPIGPARFAVRTEAWVTVGVIERLPDGGHHARFTPPFQCKRTDDPVALTAKVTEEIEAQIRQVPEQWVWMHDRWKERPKWEV